VTLVFILCAWPVASLLLALILGPVGTMNDRESADDANDRLADRDGLANVSSLHASGVARD
jgi:hypothetical protein